MSIRVVQLGSERQPGEGLRIGAVRRPPRGVPKERFSLDNWYDVWLPQLAPAPELVKQAQAATSSTEWRKFERKYEAEMKSADNARLIGLLAALSQQTDFSIGCYCDSEARCHRSVLRRLLEEQGAAVETEGSAG